MEETFSIREAAEYLRVPRATASRWMKVGRLVQVGESGHRGWGTGTRVSRASVVELARERAEKSEGQAAHIRKWLKEEE